MDFASWKDRKVLAGALKTIYRAKDADAASATLVAFDASQWAKISPPTKVLFLVLPRGS